VTAAKSGAGDSRAGWAAFDELFARATGLAEPYPYQRDFATGRQLGSLMSVPTGLGKTAAVVLGWLWRRRFHPDPSVREATPRRLVYCLPMRVLVEQTHRCAVTWLHRLGLLRGSVCLERQGDGWLSYDPFRAGGETEGVGVHLLMGGDVDHDWDRYPDRDAILIGTQDMLLSRALGRGFAMSRFRWPLPFGLLNNDCLWAIDEVQLMGNGLATTAQLQAFRRKLGTALSVKSLWMSATMRPDWLATVDFDATADAPGVVEISDADKGHPRLGRTFEATKRLEPAPFEASQDGKNEADLALARHAPGTRTLVVVNTVKRAQAVYRSLLKRRPPADVVLVHSRFRPADRERQLARLLAEPGACGTIAVCTQVVEAGVDVSSRILVTDLAPWASLVQRFGRCNRNGEHNETGDAGVVWIEHADLKDDDKLNASPYEPDDLRRAASLLRELSDVGPRSLPALTEPMSFTHVIRRKDVVELFDTTPDLAGADIDVSRFIRETDDHDVLVCWRELSGNDDPAPEEPAPARDELCPVPVGDLKGWLKKSRGSAWRWDHLEKRWTRPEVVYPGLLLLLRADEGGYAPDLGWTGKEPRTDPVSVAPTENEGDDDDRLAEGRAWATLAEHTDAVAAQLERLLSRSSLADPNWVAALRTAARWHDAGKAHPVFQNAIAPPDASPGTLWAKSEPRMRRYERPGFRHELASAIAMLQQGMPDLCAYLVAAHHGKVRLSIRSLPHEKRPAGDADRRFARGVWEGDVLPVAVLGGGERMPETKLTLSYMQLGDDPATGPSWLARMLALRDAEDLGPFRLAFLEALLRVADWRASGEPIVDPGEEVQP
jgi:CRISPR-associated endonuclease/helicase Cas3